MVTSRGPSGHCNGAAEPFATRVRDGRILMVFRLATAPATADCLQYFASFSSTEAESWGVPFQLGKTLWAVRPWLLLLGNGVLVLTGGRPGIYLSISPDGNGDTWETYNLAAEHNRRVPSHSALAFPNCSVDIPHPAPGNPCTPEVTTSYTSMLPVGPSSLMVSRTRIAGIWVAFFQECQQSSCGQVSYDRLSAGWTGPARDGAYGPADTVFTMRVDVSNASL